MSICDVWRNLVPFAQFKKREKSTHRKELLLVKLQASAKSKSRTPPWVFSHSLNCANGTKSRKASYFIINDWNKHSSIDLKHSVT